MNMVSHIDKKLQYDYYFYSVSKKKRFSKWVKPEKLKDIEVIKEVYGYSDTRAREVLDLVPIEELYKFIEKGGKHK